MEKINKSKSDRVLCLYSRLLHGQILKKEELAREFDVNDRSIQRDFEIIRNFLDKEQTEKGYGSRLIYVPQKRGYCLEQDERLNISNEEMIAISKILLESRAFTKDEMMSILDRLIETCTPYRERRLIDSLLENERFHYVEPRHHKNFLDKLIPLGKAICECRLIWIKYGKLKGKEVVERRLEPLAILFSEYYFYLVGFIEDINKEETFENPDDEFPVIYRIDRIEELQVLDEHFKIPYANRFEEGEFRKRIQFMYGGKLRKIRFKCKEESIEAILDRLPTAKILKEENGVYIVEAEVFGKGVDMWVRSQGDGIKIISS